MVDCCRRMGLAVLVIVGMATATVAQEPAVQIDGVRIDAFGIYTATVASREKADATASGYVQFVTDTKLVLETEVVCARLGVRFGLEYTLLGQPDGRTIDIDWVTRFPIPGLIKPSGETVAHSVYRTTTVVGRRTYRSNVFEEAWMIMPGVWVLEFHHAGRKIGEKAFTVYRQCPIS
jgi:hypothetical protein